MNEVHRNALRDNFQDICRDLDSADVIIYLHMKGILSEGQVSEIEAIARKEMRNMKLLSRIMEGGPNAFDDFIAALKQCGKVHLAEQILRRVPSTTGHQSGHHDARGGNIGGPSADALTKNLTKFYENMETTELVPRLESARILTRHQADEINGERQQYQRNRVLIEKLRSKGPEELSVFAKALEETLQGHLAKLLY